MASSSVEYVGFTATDAAREYTLRVRPHGGETLEYTFVIANEAFLSRRLRYQDAPDLCFHKLARELAEQADGLTQSHQTVSDGELDAYRESHAVQPSKRRPRPPQATPAHPAPPQDAARPRW